MADDTNSILITGATIVSMDSRIGVLPRGDILIDGERIKAIAPKIEAPGAQVIDGAGSIVMPGFVNSHIHLWQAMLRGFAADHTLGDYFSIVLNNVGVVLSAEDIALGNYVGALEQINAGTTTVLDWCNDANSREHAEAAIASLERSGIRAMFAYGVPSAGHGDHPPSDAYDHARELRQGRLHADDGLVRLALALRGPDFSSMEETVSDLAFARDLSVLASFHLGAVSYGARSLGAVRQLAAAHLLGPDINLVHANDLYDDEYALLAGAGTSISITPTVEMMMGHGFPAMGKFHHAAGRPALGTDVVVAVAGDMFAQMRIALATQRALDFQAGVVAKAPLDRVLFTARDVLEAATINGARALGLESETGSLSIGKRADILVLRMDTLSVLPVVDPVASIVTQAGIANVDLVMINGKILKRGGVLLALDTREVLDRIRDRAQELNLSRYQ